VNIEDNVLIIESELGDDMAEEFMAAASQDSIEKIVVKNENIASSIIQVLWCLKSEKEIEIDSQFLNKFFDNVKYSQ
jgi:hypothetical protein